VAILYYFGPFVPHVVIHIVCESSTLQLGTISKQCLLDFRHHVAKIPFGNVSLADSSPPRKNGTLIWVT